MATPRIQFTNKDFGKLHDELIARIPILTNGRWTDLNESDPGIAIVELLSSMTEQVLFYLDQSVNESFLLTAVQRGDVQNLVKLIDYQQPSITSATAVETFDPINVPLSVVFPITIPPYTRVATADNGGVEFVTTTQVGAVDPTPVNVLIPDRNTPIIMNVVQGVKETDNVSSDGTATQKFKLSHADIDASTILVTVNATSWTKVTSFVDADLNSEVFQTALDAAGNAYVIFGDGVFGVIPPDGAAIAITYIVSGGQDGTVGAGKITSLLDTLHDNALVSVTGLAVTNIEASQPGLAPESIERTKLLAPALLAALFTAKSKADYNAIVQSASTAITKVNTWGESEESPPNFKMLNRVQIAFAGVDTNGKVLLPSSLDFASVKTAIETLINGHSKKIITTRNVLVDPQFVHIVLTGSIFVDLTKYDGPTVLGAVKAAIAANLGYDVSLFGQDVYISQLEKIVGQVAGVSWSKFDITASPAVFPDLTTRYVFDPAFPTRVVGIVLRKFEIPIVEDDPITGLTSGITHIQLTVQDAVDQPKPGDVLNSPCGVSF